MDTSLIQLIRDGGMVVFALVVLFGAALSLHKGWIVMGGQYRMVLDDKTALATKLDAVTTKAEEAAKIQQIASQQQVDQLLKTLASQRDTIHELVTAKGVSHA